MEYISFRILNTIDSGEISRILLSSPKNYTKYFHPFDFNETSIKQNLSKTDKDKFFGIEINKDNLRNGRGQLIGFYMLRGLDEGYSFPMYGVFISHFYSNKGIGKLTINHAESYCKLNGYCKLLLKVNSKNIKARNLYEKYGFLYLREEKKINNIILYKQII